MRFSERLCTLLRFGINGLVATLQQSVVAGRRWSQLPQGMSDEQPEPFDWRTTRMGRLHKWASWSSTSQIARVHNPSLQWEDLGFHCFPSTFLLRKFESVRFASDLISLLSLYFSSLVFQ